MYHEFISQGPSTFEFSWGEFRLRRHSVASRTEQPRTHYHVSGGGNLLPKFMPISFSGVYLVFEVFQDAWRSNKENPSVYWNATLPCPFMASNYANWYLVPISFWMLTMPCIFYPISFCRRVSHLVVLQTKVAHLCFCLVRIQMPLLMWDKPKVPTFLWVPPFL